MATGSQRLVLHKSGARTIDRTVWFDSSLAIKRGEGVCYDVVEGTAGDVVGKRNNYVIKPSTAGAIHFAGVAAKDYAARTGGQQIVIHEPGSVCQVALGVNTTINSGIVTCRSGGADVGRFSAVGFPGRGSAVPLQTKTALVETAVLDGGGTVSGTTLTDTGAFASTTAGDLVYLLGGAVAATGDAGPVAGIYKVSSVTSDNAVVLDSAPGDGVVSYYILQGNPRCLAYLLDGQESGLQEWINPIDNVAVECSRFGVSHIGGGGITMGADSTSTAITPAYPGILKGFHAHGAITTSEYKVPVVGIQSDGSSSLATLEFDAADESALLMGMVQDWLCLRAKGATEA